MTRNTKRIVPWISMEEWGQVYSQVYSEKVEDKWIGLNQMTMWKARVAKLPLGVECSLHLLQAILRDEQYKKAVKGSLSENDVTLMYSTAIIRFINLISHLGQMERHQPISAVAKMAGIPEWVVAIRHEATHAKMPSLSILRPGAQLAMEWLKENYWRAEEEDSLDLYWPETKAVTSRMLRAHEKMAGKCTENGSPAQYQVISEELQLIVSMLIALSKEIASLQYFNDIQSPDLKRFVVELWRQINDDPQLSQRAIDKMRLPLKDVHRVMVTEIERILSEWVETEGGEAGSSDSENLETLKGKCFVSAVCQCPRLLDPPHRGSLFSSLKPIWRLIQKWHVLPYLMEMLPSKAIENEKDLTSHLVLISTLTNSILQAIKNPKAKGNLFRFDPSLDSINWDAIVRCILKDPRAESWNTASKMFQLCKSPPTAEMQLHLAALQKIFTSQTNPVPKANGVGSKSTLLSNIYTIDMLAPYEKNADTKIVDDQSHPNGQDSSTGPSPDINEWTLCTEEHNWASIPIGSLPGVRDSSTRLQLNSAEWQLVEAESITCEPDLLVHGTKRTGERFNWNSLQRKRRRRGGLTKDGPVGDMIPVPQPGFN